MFNVTPSNAHLAFFPLQQLVDVQILPAYLNNLKVNILTADLIINSMSQKYQQLSSNNTTNQLHAINDATEMKNCH